MAAKHPGREYIITSLPEDSVWEEEEKKLIGYRIRVLRPTSAIPHEAYMVEILTGPHTGRTVIARGWGLRLAPREDTCRCRAYPFPHRKGSGRCSADKDEGYCGTCGKACAIAKIESDLSPSEAWGIVETTPRFTLCSSCCGAEVYTDPELKTLYTGDPYP